MTVSWVFLAVAIVGALFTITAIHPPSRPQALIGFAFFAGWLTTELAILHLAWQVAAVVVFVALGALESWPGWLALVITLVSWIGLVRVIRASGRTQHAFADALDGALGAEWRDALDARWRPDARGIAWRNVLFPFRFRIRGVERTRDLVYDEAVPTRRHRLDIYRKPDVGPGAPVLLQIHGGAWMIGNKNQQALPLMYRLAARGWVCVAINYRLSPKGTWPDHLVDCKRALAWIREHIAEFGGDPDYVVVTGGSAGGHLTAMMGLTPNDPTFQPGFEAVDTRVRAMVPFYGVFDFTDRFGIRGKNDGLRGVLERYIIKRSRASDPEVFDNASPMSHVNSDAPPALVVHGDLDLLAPVAEARKFVEMLRAESQAPVAYVELAGAQHAFEIFHSPRTAHTLTGVEWFLAWQLTTDPPRGIAEIDDPTVAAAAEPVASDQKTTARTAP